MTALDFAEAWGHEEVHLVRDASSGLRAVIAVHDTTLGPAVGGTRMRLYPSFDDAVLDALRLARAMTYKCALAEMPYGGGKAVIFGDPGRDKSRALLAAYARELDRLGGRFETGCDMGIDLRDVAVMGRLTKHVGHTPSGARNDTAALAALGVFAGIEAAAHALGRETRALHVALQGVGQVGARLARFLAEAGARLTITPCIGAEALCGVRIKAEALRDIRARRAVIGAPDVAVADAPPSREQEVTDVDVRRSFRVANARERARAHQELFGDGASS